MKWASFILTAGQIGLAVLGARVAPDYYARSVGSVMNWAYTKGLWVLLLSLAMVVSQFALIRRHPSKISYALLAISILMCTVWLAFPYGYSVLGDGLFFRFP